MVNIISHGIMLYLLIAVTRTNCNGHLVMFWCASFYCRTTRQHCRSTHSLLIRMNPTKPICSVALDEFICRLYLLQCCI